MSAAFAALLITGTPDSAKYEPLCGNGGRFCGGVAVVVDARKSTYHQLKLRSMAACSSVMKTTDLSQARRRCLRTLS